MVFVELNRTEFRNRVIGIGNCMKASDSKISAASDTLHVKARAVKGTHPQFQKLLIFLYIQIYLYYTLFRFNFAFRKKPTG